MADYDFPPDLLDLQRAYWKTDEEVQRVTAALPSSQEVLEGAMTDEQREELTAARSARLDALEALNRHPWWEQPEQRRDRHAAWMALQKAAKA
ncbi:hypothetical protein [Streptosporangium vulgare]|uniref:Uncharacterized protein n=1 Tax=Streptosporangium vulgare TaxID=46190 RepID=A0ABV5TS00_9ACTN